MAANQNGITVVLPSLGENVTEATITRWLKAAGDRLEVGEPLLEVSTDKVDTEVPSPAAGVLRDILIQEDAVVEVGAAIAVLAVQEGAAAIAPPPPPTPTPTP